MMRTRQGAFTVALGAVVALAAAACSGSGSGGGSTAGSSATAASKGGTLYILNVGPHNGLDPQQSYVGADLEFANRVYARSLTMYTAGEKPELVPDLATDTGTMSDGGKTWAFTLKGDAKWQDGKAVTCDDVKYGISRTFATDVISNGPTYILSFLDVPEDADGAPVYKGPYKPSAAGDAAFNKAITCEGEKLTLHFKKPWADFNQATASLAAFSAFRKDKDKGANSLFDVFSDGPYMLEGTFDANKGGTWVRNPSWTGGDDLRKAYPDKIVDVEGLTTEVIFQRLLANGGEDKNAITFSSAPASLLAQIVGTTSAKDRTFNPTAPYVNYLTPNYQSAAMKNPKIRQAFAMSTNKDAYVTANGGPQVMTPTNAICNPALACYQDSNPFGAPSAGDPVGAKKVLTDAGITTPVPITVVYRKTATADKAYSALKQTWDQGGFNTTLEGITDKYYRTISSAASKSKDVFSAGWGADWPSGSTDIPPLFDGRINITATSSNQDYGYFNDDAVNKAIDAAYLISDAAEREKAWGAIDAMIVADGGVVPLVAQKFVFVAGSNIKNFEINSLLGGYADFANIAVQ
ncbi:ABC transporter substrate-binding protein [Dermatophilaceae bacterium Soc4.6]